MSLLHRLRRAVWRFQLSLVQGEIKDTLDDMSYELNQNNFGNYRGLADYHTQLVLEANELRDKLGLRQFLTT